MVLDNHSMLQHAAEGRCITNDFSFQKCFRLEYVASLIGGEGRVVKRRDPDNITKHGHCERGRDQEVSPRG